MTTINRIDPFLIALGFDFYSDFSHHENTDERVTILTCTKGKYSGDVVEITYKNSGIVVKTEVYSQFKASIPVLNSLPI